MSAYNVIVSYYHNTFCTVQELRPRHFLIKQAFLALIFLVTFVKVGVANTLLDSANQDTAEVNLLNKQGYSIRLTDHEQTIKKAEQALELA
ncbi:MAG: hypothetical protein ABI166_16045, partial [Mucilaginibacter sp.]